MSERAALTRRPRSALILGLMSAWTYNALSQPCLTDRGGGAIGQFGPNGAGVAHGSAADAYYGAYGSRPYVAPFGAPFGAPLSLAEGQGPVGRAFESGAVTGSYPSLHAESHRTGACRVGAVAAGGLRPNGWRGSSGSVCQHPWRRADDGDAWKWNMSGDKGSMLRLRNNVAAVPPRGPKRVGFTASAGPKGGFATGPPVSTCSRANGSRKTVGGDFMNRKSRLTREEV